MTSYPSRLFKTFFAIAGTALLSLSTSTAQASKAADHESSAPADAAKVAQAIQASFYHPDHLGGLDCAVAVNWRDFFKAMNVDPPADRIKILEDLEVRVHAPRGKRADVTYKWAGEAPDGSNQITDGLQQMIGGFFQMYWPMIASFPISKASDITRLEPQTSGTRKVSSVSPQGTVIVTIDDQSTPTQFSFDSPAMKGTFGLRYTPSPSPVAGDLRRITGFDADEQIGTSTIHLKVGLDYQKVDTWNVPHHVNLDLGTYSISFDLTGCSALPPVN